MINFKPNLLKFPHIITSLARELCVLLSPYIYYLYSLGIDVIITKHARKYSL